MPPHWVGFVGAIGGVLRVRFVVVLVGAILAAAVAQPIYASTGFGPPKFALPWAVGSVGRLTGGPHSNSGQGRPWSSLDFAGPVAGVPYPVRAAAGGTVVRPCPNWVQIRHRDGWTTSYYHLAHITVEAGQHVDRGHMLGWTSTRAGCGGSATGPHVHFSLKHNGDYINIRGFVFGGWTVYEGSAPYEGCLVRGDDRRCAPGGKVYNFGV